MQVHFFGNAGNTYYRLAKLLRPRGIDARLFLTEGDYFTNDPANEDPELKENYPSWITWLPRRPRLDLLGLDTIRACRGADVVHMAGDRAIAGLISGKPYIFNPSGGDLFSASLWPWQRLRPWREKLLGSTVHLPKLRTVRVGLQRLGIRRATAIQIGWSSYIYEYCFEHLPIPRLRFYIPPVVPQKALEGPRSSEATALPPSLCDPGTLTILHPTRQNWRLDDRVSGTHKGNDRLFRAVARAREQGIKLKLFVVEYMTHSPDLEASKQLVRELGIGDIVTWLPQMPVSELFGWYRAVDLVADQFTNGGLSLICYEAMACGTPVLIRTHPDNAKLFGEMPPTIDVSTERDVLEAIKTYAANDSLLRSKGEECRRWAHAMLGSEALARRYVEMYEAVLAKKRSSVARRPDG